MQSDAAGGEVALDLVGELVGVENIYPKFDLALQAAKEKIEEK